MPSTKQKNSEWIEQACNHAADYIIRFLNNPGVERIAVQFDPEYADIRDPDERLDRLSHIASKYWDFRKGRERYEVVANEPMDEAGSELGDIISKGTAHAEMTSRSSATLKHYDVVVVLGGAYKSPYYRMRYALEQKITYDKLVFLGCERPLLPPEQEQTAFYAPGAQTEYDLGTGAVRKLLGSELMDVNEYGATNSEWRITCFHKKDGTPILVLSAPPYYGRVRASTADTYRFLLRTEGESIGLGKDVLCVTAAMYRYAQYFDAVRTILLRTGANVEMIGYEPAYGGVEFKPSKSLQEVKSAVDAARRLRNAIKKHRPGKPLTIAKHWEVSMRTDIGKRQTPDKKASAASQAPE